MSATGVDNNSKVIPSRARGYMFNKNGELINAEFIDMSIKIGGGSLYSTVKDLNSFIYQLADGKVLTIPIKQLSSYEEINGEPVLSADGRVKGFCHRFIYRLKEDLCITVLGNNYSKIALTISDDIYKIYKNEKYQIPENFKDKAMALTIDQLLQYEGVYNFGFGPLRILKVIDGKLTYSSEGRSGSDVLIPVGDDTFFYIQYWVLVRFKKTKSDQFDTIEWIMGDNFWSGNKLKNKQK